MNSSSAPVPVIPGSVSRITPVLKQRPDTLRFRVQVEKSLPRQTFRAGTRAVVDELRRAALVRVLTHVEAINRQTGRDWSLGGVTFGTANDRRKGILETVAQDAERVVLLAAVTLKSATAGQGKNYVINERL